jgi:membrane fusion protein, copper/silver efflux system
VYNCSRFLIKRLAAAVCCLTLAAGAAAFGASDAVKSIVDSYLQIHALLVADKTDGVKAQAAAIVKTAAAMGDTGAAIVKAARAVESATDLKTTRDAFGPLSEAVIAAAQAEGMTDLGVKQAFCPMVKRPWLQKDDKIRNPYYGTTMLECGEFKK